MAFPQANSRELQNRKILEELQLKKQMLLKQGVVQSLGPSISLPATVLAPTTSAAQPSDANSINSSQRAALANAQAASFEQYATSPHIASRMLYVAQTQFEDIEDCNVADLGTGCGILSIGAFLLGAAQVTGFDIDLNALSICAENCEELEAPIEMICCNVINYLPGKYEKFFDTVIMNPPFGTKHNTGIDIKFLEIASKLTKNAIYSLHKTSTRDHVLRKGEQFGFNSEVVAELRYDLPQTYKFHKKKSVDVEVDFIRFSAKK
ncbi:hypothetical protein TSAR_003032 [Trichomalopsis sarcophagae]|uniref:Methyltransferase-like protein 5 n=1 Tax=Trichomalopsis sarcophagae TaxID=543379 RepID=A0A232FGP4_9HYME|nr:hypothetical protein TSAR_003032 [Trichomalopsis sarcophagae]